MSTFNSFAKKDSIMKKYYEGRSLKLKDVLQDHEVAHINRKIFLSDLTPVASKLSYTCRNLKSEKWTSSYKFSTLCWKKMESRLH